MFFGDQEARPVDVFSILFKIYDEEDWVRSFAENALARRLKAEERSLLANRYLGSRQMLMFDDQAFNHGFTIGSGVRRVHELYRSFDSEIPAVAYWYLLNLYDALGMSDERRSLKDDFLGEKVRMYYVVSDALWNRQHDEVDRLAEQELAKYESSHIRAAWVISCLYRRKYERAL